MGYACPVCGTEEVDAIHLANHLAVTASLGREEHVEWLEAHAPDWHEKGPEKLADAIDDHAPEVEVGFDGEDGAAPPVDADVAATAHRSGRSPTAGESIPDDVLRTAREFTDQMTPDEVTRERERNSEAGQDGRTDTETQ